MEIDKEAEGVYVRTIEVDRNRTSSFTRNYTGIFNSIPYLFIIRKTGGIATGAYVDGTNQSSYVEAISTSIDEFYKITKK